MRARLLPVAIGIALASTACSVPTANSTAAWCHEFGVLMLEAQSVPSAQMLPCVEPLPLGWDVGPTDIADGGTVFALSSDIGGSEAVEVELTASCGVEGFVEVPTDEAGAKRYELVESVTGGFRGTRAYVFDGGCATLDFRFETEASAVLVNEASLAVGFVSRADVDQAVQDITDGREHLDPPAEEVEGNS